MRGRLARWRTDFRKRETFRCGSSRARTETGGINGHTLQTAARFALHCLIFFGLIYFLSAALCARLSSRSLLKKNCGCRCVELRALCDEVPRTPPGPEGSNGTGITSCAAEYRELVSSAARKFFCDVTPRYSMRWIGIVARLFRGRGCVTDSQKSLASEEASYNETRHSHRVRAVLAARRETVFCEALRTLC
jgi:hypothetical protein